MSTSDETIMETAKEWRELGFYYEYNDSKNEWYVIGSKSGLKKFVELLLKYTTNQKNKKKSEHEHYGPYTYLKIMTWDTPDINSECIQGTLADLKRLAGIVEKHLNLSKVDSSFIINKEYSENAKSTLVFEVKEDSFDPSLADSIYN